MHDMQNPHGIFSLNTIQDDVFLDGETIKASAEVMFPPSANVRIFPQRADGFHQPVDKADGVQFAVLSDMVPNCERIATRALGKPVTLHQSARGLRVSVLRQVQAEWR